MALLDPYVTAEEYRAAKGDFKTAVDAILDAQLDGMSRLLDRKLRLIPGAFNSASSEVRTVDSYGGHVLWLRDRDGRGFFLQTGTYTIGIDTENDGTYDGYTFDQSTAWLRPLPDNASDGSEPAYALEFLTGRTGATLTEWPDLVSGVQVSGTLGWATVPQLIKELVIHRVTELRDAHKAGSTGELGTFDGGIPMQPNTKWLFKEAETLYTRRVPVF